jgi:hypothetical protein
MSILEIAMRRILLILPLAFLTVAGCSAPPAPDTAAPTTDASAPAKSAPDNPSLGSHEWYAWVDQVLAVSDDGHGPTPGSAEWNAAVQAKLGQEAPQTKPGSPEWQQAVDALLRTRVASSKGG